MRHTYGHDMQAVQSDAAAMDDANDAQSPLQGVQPPDRPTRPSPGPSGGVADKLRQALQGGSFHPSADADSWGFARTHLPIDRLLPLSTPARVQPDSLQAQLQQAAAVLAASQLTEPASSAQTSAAAPHQHDHASTSPTRVVTTAVAVSLPPSTEGNSQQADRPTLLPKRRSPGAPETAGPALQQAALAQAQSQAQAIASSQAEQLAQAELDTQAHGHQHHGSQGLLGQSSQGLTDHNSTVSAAELDSAARHQPASQSTCSNLVQDSLAELSRQQQDPGIDAHTPPEVTPVGYNVTEAITGKFNSLPPDRRPQWETRDTGASHMSTDPSAAALPLPFSSALSTASLEQHAGQARHQADSSQRAEQTVNASHQDDADAAEAVQTDGSPEEEGGMQGASPGQGTKPKRRVNLGPQPNPACSSLLDQLVWSRLHGAAAEHSNMTSTADAAGADVGAAGLSDGLMQADSVPMVCGSVSE